MGSFNSVQRNALWGLCPRGAILCTAFSLGVFFILATPFAAPSALADQITLADFTSLPLSPTNMPEMIWASNELYEGPGARGTGYGNTGAGDGQQQVSQQVSPGLLVQTPFAFPVISQPGYIPGSAVNTTTLPNTTSFFDATLDIGPTPGGGASFGLPALGAAIITGPQFTQMLGSGTFQIYSTDPTGPNEDDYTLLLSGTIHSALITGLLGKSTGSVLSADVTYTGGAILTAAGLGNNVGGEFSWTLTNAKPAFAITGGDLAPFQANGSGTFTAVPEPGTFVLLAVGAVALGGYTWRKRRGAAALGAA